MTKNKFILILALLSASTLGQAQNYDAVLRNIEANNTELKTLRAQTDAAKTACRTGILPDNPEVEFGYLWGSPQSEGSRIDFNVTQSLDFPTTYVYRDKLADAEAQEAELRYATAHKDLLAEVRQHCIRLIYCNILQKENEYHVKTAQAIQDAYQRMYDNGEKSILDLNKARLELLSARKELENNRVEQETLLGELMQMNGGQPVVLPDTVYPIVPVTEPFDDWYKRIEPLNPSLQQLEAQQHANQRRIQLSKSLWAPGLSVGYKSERTPGAVLQGIGVGISLPLWSNSRSIKSAMAEKTALQSEAFDLRTQYYSSLKSKYRETERLKGLLDEYRATLSSLNTDALLLKALEQGEISLIDYILERRIYREALHEAYDTEYALQKALVELTVYAEE